MDETSIEREALPPEDIEIISACLFVCAHEARREAQCKDKASRKQLLAEADKKDAIAAKLALLAQQPEAVGPSPGLLMSMALRYDHGLGMPGYYDTQPLQFGPSHKQRLEGTLGVMRQLWEEVTGNGFYQPEKEADYTAMLEAVRAPKEQAA